MRLAKSFAADTGNGRLIVGVVSGEKGLATIRFPELEDWSGMTNAVRLVRLLQRLEAMDRANIGLSRKWRPGLTPELDGWLRKPFPSPEVPAEPPKSVAAVVQPRTKSRGRRIGETYDRWRDGITPGN
jgi:hypothetical protein